MLRVQLFGNLRIHDDERRLECFQSTRAKELFCYLLLHRDHPHSRETLAGLFWADCDKNQSRKYLRQALWQLHQSVRDTRHGDDGRCLTVEGEFVSWNERADVWVDVFSFERAVASAGRTTGDKLSPQCADDLRHAVSLYLGDLMEGWYQDWCLFHRERLHNNYLVLLEKLMDYCELHHDYDAGLAFGERLLSRDKVRERSYVRTMRLHYLAGDRAGAIRQFHRCAAALQEELGIKPSRRTVDVYERVCAEHLDVFPALAAAPSSPEAESPVSLALVPGLRELKSQLLKLQHHVQFQIQTIDNALTASSATSTIE
jgi:DNA-binding SARP family transcriptional activator